MGHSFGEVDGKPQRVAPEHVNLGLAVDVQRKDGSRTLIVPVIKRADAMDFAGFREVYEELIAKPARRLAVARRHAGRDITLTNPGGIGTVASVPRLMPGQGSIVATGAIALPAGPPRGPGELAELGVSKVMTMTSTYDHRVIQGAESGAFLRRIEELLQGDDGFYEHGLPRARPGRAAGGARRQPRSPCPPPRRPPRRRPRRCSPTCRRRPRS